MHTLSNGTGPALVLFFKRPRIGVGKQRVAATVGQEKAYQLAQALLDCALEDMADWRGVLVFAVASTEDVLWVEETIIPQFPNRTTFAMAQGEGNMGQRLNSVDARLRDMGLRELYYIGSDAPVLNQHIYTTARNMMSHHDATFARSEDGGVTLMASKKPWPPLAELPWSTAILGDTLVACCKRSDWNVAETDGLYDVDTIDELNRIRSDLAGDTRPARVALLEQIDALLSGDGTLVA